MTARYTIAIVILAVVVELSNALQSNIPEDGRLNFTEIGRKYGRDVEEHDVVTEDGYILKLFHIPGNKTQPVFLIHGILDSGLVFILRGKSSLTFTLAEAGYDVWVGNIRGTIYSRRHVSLDPDSDKQFWNYTLHEMGYYDIPASIDYILKRTGEEKLSAIGHSQGTTAFYVLGATRPEYNKKIKVFISLAPVCFLNNIEPPLSLVLPIAPLLDTVLQKLGMEEVLGDKSIIKVLIDMICTQNRISYDLCAQIFFATGGEDPDELEPEFIPILIGHYPTGTSRKNLVHTAQIGLRRRFTYFDYGSERNLMVYNSTTPPDYDLGKVTMNIALLAGKNDHISTLKDVKLLRSKLPAVVEFRVMDREQYNHVDHVWGRHMNKYLFPHILRILEKFM